MINEFEQKHYKVIKNAVSKDICQLLSDYAKFKAQLKPNFNKNDSLSGVHREYGDVLMETLLERLQPKIEAATGIQLSPTLSFYYVYKNGHQLSPHKDRRSCQIVAGLCINADEAFKQKFGNWPLVIKVNGEALPVQLDYGDILIFKGHETEHWREVFQGEWFISAIFGYVDKNGPFKYQKYDQRKGLGRSHIGMFRWLWGDIVGSILARMRR